MMTSDHIIDVTEADFEYQVIHYSQQTPVVVDFWAEWCIPCRTLGPLLERLTEDAHGAFRLAKVNVDHNQNLAQRYNIHSIPSVKAFKDGVVVAEFTGAQPEQRIREFVRKIAPSKTDLTLEKGLSLIKLEQWQSAESAFQMVLEDNPDNTIAVLGLAKCILSQGRAVEAVYILKDFPTSREYAAAQRLLPLAEALSRIENGFRYDEDDPLAAAYSHALRLFKKGNFPAAMDGLLEVLRQNKQFRNDEARLVILGMFEVLGDENPLTRQYRQELASVLF